MKLKQQFIVRNIMGENILVPKGSTAMDFNGLITLNETALDIWNLLPEAEDEAAVVERMLGIYDIDRETLEKDVKAFLQELREAGIL